MTQLPVTLRRATRRHVAQLINRVLNLAVFSGAIASNPLPRGWLPKAPKAESVGERVAAPKRGGEAARRPQRAGRDRRSPRLPRRCTRSSTARGCAKARASASTWADSTLRRASCRSTRTRPTGPAPGSSTLACTGPSSSGTRPSASRRRPRDPRLPRIRVGEACAPLPRPLRSRGHRPRAALSRRSANKLRLRAHDMRAFFVTAAMYAGKDALWITDRTGHTSLGMLRTYERDVRRWRELGEAPVDAGGGNPRGCCHARAAMAAAQVAATAGPTSSAAHGNYAKVHGKGVEPLRLAAAEPKSAASASFATRAVISWGIREASVADR